MPPNLCEKQLYHMLEFPKVLQVTILALIRGGPYSAAEITATTGKARAVESSYLNQLVLLKFAKKQTEIRPQHGCGKPKVRFSVDLEALNW
jgi:hypothetical protein